MAKLDIADSVRIIFEQEKLDANAPFPKIITVFTNKRPQFQNAEKLEKLLLLCKKNGMEEDFYKSIVESSKQFYDEAYLGIDFLIRKHHLVEAGLISMNEDIPIYVIRHSVNSLNKILAHEKNFFTDDELNLIRSFMPGIVKRVYEVRFASDTRWNDEYLHLIDKIHKQIQEIQLNRLKVKLDEIHEDEMKNEGELLIGKIKDLKLSNKESLEKFQDAYQKQFDLASDDTNYNNCLNLARNFLQSFCGDLCIELEKKGKKKVPRGEGGKVEFSTAKGYLHENLPTTKCEHHLLDQVYSFLSDTASHSLITSRERARVGKNMTIEVCLLLTHIFEK